MSAQSSITFTSIRTERLFAHTECSIHWVQHTPKIVCRPFILTISSWPLNVASASGVPPYRSTATSHFSIRASKGNSFCHIHTFARSLTEESSPSGPSIDRVQVPLQSHSITASKCISKLTRSPAPSTRPISLDHGRQVYPQPHSITASKCISKLARSQPPSVSPNSLNHGLQVHLQTRSITASMCISRLAGFWPASSHGHLLQVHLQTRSITAWKFAQSWPPSAHLQSHSFTASKCISSTLDYGLQVHLQSCLITALEYISVFTRSSFSGAPWIALKLRLQPVQIYCV